MEHDYWFELEHEFFHVSVLNGNDCNDCGAFSFVRWSDYDSDKVCLSTFVNRCYTFDSD